MEIRLLGALEVLDDAGVPVNVAGAKLRALLAVLATRPGRVVPADRLIDDLWGEDAPETARNSLQVLVFKLRRALPEGVVATRGPGYALAVSEGSVDTGHFRQLCERGREAFSAGEPGQAAASFREALALWRGDALADFAYEEFARAEIGQLEEERRAVFEERVEADLACGRDADLVAELEAAVKAAPLRERPRAQLMVALYRSGRQVEALRHYQEARRALGEELGLEPGPELAALEAAILAHKPSLGPASVALPRPRPEDEPRQALKPGRLASAGGDASGPQAVFVGRDQPLGQLRAALARAESGSRSVVLVAGESGIGKTELVRAVTRDRPLLAWGTCVDDAAAGGLWPWSRALEQLTRAIGAERARDFAGPDAGLLATIAGSFGRARSRPGTARDRLLLLDAVCRWLEAVASSSPVIVVLDDLQWADGSTLALLDLTARSPHPAALCVIGCYRPGELDGPARAHLPRLAMAVEHIELKGLDRRAVSAMVAALGSVPEQAAEEIFGRAGGHPVFTRELAMVWGGGDAPATIPTAVRDAIELRARRLDRPTRQVLEVASFMGNALQVGVVATVLGVEPAEVETACEAAITASILVGTPVAARFAHDLYRETLAASVPPSRRPALHQAVGAALEERHLRGAPANAADVARHFVSAVAVDGAARAAAWARAAASADGASFAFGEAAAHFRRWRDAVADAGLTIAGDLRLEMLLAEADALARAGTPADARGLLRSARELAAQAGDYIRLGEVALAMAQLGAQFSARRDDVVRELDQALAAVAGKATGLEARLAARLARELQHSVAEDRPRAGPLSERALRLGREAGERGDLGTLVACLLAHHDVLWSPGGAAARVGVAKEIVATAERAGDSERRAEGLLLLANALLEQASPAYVTALEQCMSQLEKLGQLRHRYTIETRRAAVVLLAGDLEAAAALIDQAAELGRRIREPDAENVHMAQRLELVRARGEPAELVAFARDSLRHYMGAPVLGNALAAGFFARAGELAAARRHLTAVLDLGTWRADRSYVWSGLVHEVSVAAIAVHDDELCASLLADLLPVAATCGVNGAVISFAGSHAHSAGLLSAALGHDSGPLFALAREAYTRLGATGWLAELQGL